MAAGPVVEKVLAAYSGKLRLVIKHYPYRYRDFSRLAAEASLAARDQGKYWEMHDILIARSPKLDRSSLIKYAGELKLDVKKFAESVDGEKHKKEIDRDIKLAEDMDLFSTPTFYINGRRVIGERSLEEFKKIIDEELGAKR